MGKNTVHDLLNNADIQDPLDFPGRADAPGLRDLDGALRCKICQELFEAPVVLACGHCFCSLCARNQISEKAVCPVCWKPASEGHLRVNPTMEEAVVAWKGARAYVLRLATDDRTRQNTLRGTPESSHPRPTKKRKTSPDSEIELIESVSGPSSPRRSHVGITKPKSKSKARFTSIERSGEPFSSPNSPDDGCVECPACARQVNASLINEHLDSGCKMPPTKITDAKEKDEWSKLFAGKAPKKGKDRLKADVNDDDTDSPIPKVSYTVLKDKQIRDLLAEHDLLTTGDRPLLIARHQRWVSVYNANLDHMSTQRKRQAELRAEMRRWEEGRRATSNSGTAREVALSINVSEYRRENKAEFAVLVERAKPKKPSLPSNLPQPQGQVKKDHTSINEADDEQSVADITATQENGMVVIDVDSEA
ncbi:hypothetical protein BV25DRAFT_1901820 [Artomyces pyxidatus]|uniref:Uncharacterized protein n=1 Tax=Artomyces pyxidatus TaxID=48021 RepID=A0ACB8STJ9_9AGAM|nr:hypothetical protein BV25DRAFT_1901820 [Artomyces pyxidatus]